MLYSSYFWSGSRSVQTGGGSRKSTPNQQPNHTVHCLGCAFVWPSCLYVQTVRTASVSKCFFLRSVLFWQSLLCWRGCHEGDYWKGHGDMFLSFCGVWLCASPMFVWLWINGLKSSSQIRKIGKNSHISCRTPWYLVGGDQNRDKTRVNIGLTFIRWPKRRLQWGDVAPCLLDV